MNLLTSSTAWWRLRNARERQMVLVMFAAVAAFVWWYGLLVPLQAWRTHSQGRYDRAASEWLEVRDTTATIRELGAGRPRDPATLAAEVLDSATDHGVAVNRQRHNARGRFVVGIDAVDAPQLLGWLGSLQQDRRIAVAAAKVEKRDGRLSAELDFRTTVEGASR